MQEQARRRDGRRVSLSVTVAVTNRVFCHGELSFHHHLCLPFSEGFEGFLFAMENMFHSYIYHPLCRKTKTGRNRSHRKKQCILTRALTHPKDFYISLYALCCRVPACSRQRAGLFLGRQPTSTSLGYHLVVSQCQDVQCITPFIQSIIHTKSVVDRARLSRQRAECVAFLAYLASKNHPR